MHTDHPGYAEGPRPGGESLYYTLKAYVYWNVVHKAIFLVIIPCFVKFVKDSALFKLETIRLNFVTCLLNKEFKYS